MKTICALLAFRLQQAASTLRSWVGVGHDNLVAMDHALVAVVLWVGGGEGRLMARGVRGMWVVLGLIPRWRQDHGEARASVSLPRSWVTCRQKDKLFDDTLGRRVVPLLLHNLITWRHDFIQSSFELLSRCLASKTFNTSDYLKLMYLEACCPGTDPVPQRAPLTAAFLAGTVHLCSSSRHNPVGWPRGEE